MNSDPYVFAGFTAATVVYLAGLGVYARKASNRANRRRNRNRGSTNPQAGSTIARAGAFGGPPSVRSYSKSIRARANARRTGARVRNRAGYPMPTSRGTVPLIGYKAVSVAPTPNGPLGIEGARANVPYPNPSKAKCGLRRSHTAPLPECSCGFYAMERSYASFDVMLMAGLVAEVELAGRVIVATRGFRAEWQRVVRLIITDHCYICHRPPAHISGGHAYCKKHADPDWTWPIGEVEAALEVEVIRVSEFKEGNGD